MAVPSLLYGSQGGLVTHLRQQLLAELQRRNYSPATIQIYLLAIRQRAAHFQCPPDQLGPE
jgi:hypothetical protein